MRDTPSPTSSTDDENAPASSSSMKTSDSRQNLTLARSNSFKRFKAMEDQAKAEKEQEAPKFRSEGRSRSTSSARVAGILHKVSLQFVLGRVAANDPALGIIDLSNNAQFLGLATSQKARAINVLCMGHGLHTIKLNTLGLDNSHSAAIARLLAPSTSCRRSASRATI